MKLTSIFRLFTLLVTLGLAVSAAKAGVRKKTVYVWDFKTEQRQITERTSFITEEFEDALKEIGLYKFLDRRDGDRIRNQATLEGMINVTNIMQIGEAGRKALRLKSADMVIFGKVSEDTASGHVTVKADFENWNGEKEIFDHIDIPLDKIGDKPTRRLAMADLAKKLYADALKEKESNESDAVGPNNSVPDTDWKTSGVFSFRVAKCSALGPEVDVTVEVKVNDGDDHTLFVASEQTGGIALVALRAIGVCTIIDPNGIKHVAKSIEFAQERSDNTGQSWFKVYNNTKPTMILVFDNVSRKVMSVRLDLGVGDATGNPIRKLPVSFKDLKVERNDNE